MKMPKTVSCAESLSLLSVESIIVELVDRFSIQNVHLLFRESILVKAARSESASLVKI